jgi:RNA recognition motif-containing protein
MHSSNLCIRNLSFSVTTEILTKLFSVYGEVKHVKVISGKGLGFIEMSRQAEAEQAMKSLNGYELEGRVIMVNEAKSAKKRRKR